MTTKPDNCAACGKPTQSHNIAIDVSDIDVVGLPTLAGVCCHRCWAGDTEDVPPIGDMYNDQHKNDSEHLQRKLANVLDVDLMVATAVPVEDLTT